MRKIRRIVIADDHALVRKGLKLIIAKRPDFEIAAEAGDGLELLSLLKRSHAPDVVIMDLSMPDLRGVEAIREIRDIHPGTRVLVLTMHRDEDFLCQSFFAGADGYLLKEDVAEELFDALDAVLRGEIYVSPLLEPELRNSWIRTCRGQAELPAVDVLSSRETQVLKLVAEGAANKEVEAILNLSVYTVETHRTNLMQKLGLHNTAEIVPYAVRKKIIS